MYGLAVRHFIASGTYIGDSPTFVSESSSLAQVKSYIFETSVALLGRLLGNAVQAQCDTFTIFGNLFNSPEQSDEIVDQVSEIFDAFREKLDIYIVPGRSDMVDATHTDASIFDVKGMSLVRAPVWIESPVTHEVVKKYNEQWGGTPNSENRGGLLLAGPSASTLGAGFVSASKLHWIRDSGTAIAFSKQGYRLLGDKVAENALLEMANVGIPLSFVAGSPQRKTMALMRAEESRRARPRGGYSMVSINSGSIDLKTLHFVFHEPGDCGMSCFSTGPMSYGAATVYDSEKKTLDVIRVSRTQLMTVLYRDGDMEEQIKARMKGLQGAENAGDLDIVLHVETMRGERGEALAALDDLCIRGVVKCGFCMGPETEEVLDN